MMRMIDADAILPMMETKMDMQDLYLPIHFQEMVIDEMPTVDAVPVVRCGECKHYVIFKMGNKELPFPVCEHFGMKMPSDEFYCAGGERREDDGKNREDDL